jgi:hypothetical protein
LTFYIHEQENLCSKIRSNISDDRPNTYLVELGAGKGNYNVSYIDVSGGLSLTIAPEVASLKLPGSKIILVDRKNSRRKDDMYLRNLGFEFSRIFADLKDIDLHLLLPSSVQRVIFTGKHLCGAATCMSLRAIASLSSQRPHLFISCHLFYW